MSVSGFIRSVCLRLILSADFLAIRKIPISERPYFTGSGDQPMDLPPAGEDEDEPTRPDDAEVSVFLGRIRKTILTDRAIHDQVSCMHVD
jgi:ATP-dependent RNA helicase DDX55/SPB4